MTPTDGTSPPESTLEGSPQSPLVSQIEGPEQLETTKRDTNLPTIVETVDDDGHTVTSPFRGSTSFIPLKKTNDDGSDGGSYNTMGSYDASFKTATDGIQCGMS